MCPRRAPTVVHCSSKPKQGPRLNKDVSLAVARCQLAPAWSLLPTPHACADDNFPAFIAPWAPLPTTTTHTHRTHHGRTFTFTGKEGSVRPQQPMYPSSTQMHNTTSDTPKQANTAGTMRVWRGGLPPAPHPLGVPLPLQCLSRLRSACASRLNSRTGTGQDWTGHRSRYVTTLSCPSLRNRRTGRVIITAAACARSPPLRCTPPAGPAR